MPRPKGSKNKKKRVIPTTEVKDTEVEKSETVLDASEAPQVKKELTEPTKEVKALRNPLDRPVIVFVNGTPVRLGPKQVVFLD